MNDDAIERNQAKDDQNIHTEKVEKRIKMLMPLNIIIRTGNQLATAGNRKIQYI